MNVYGKEATACYDAVQGLRFLKRGGGRPEAIEAPPVDTLVEELEEFAAAVRGGAEPEVNGDRAIASLAVIRAGIRASREGRRVEVAEVLAREGG